MVFSRDFLQYWGAQATENLLGFEFSLPKYICMFCFTPYANYNCNYSYSYSYNNSYNYSYKNKNKKQKQKTKT